MKTEHEAMLKSMSQPAKATPQSPRPQSLEFPLSLSNHPVSNEKVVLHDADGMRIAIFELESEAAYVFRAVNAYAALQAENAELREALEGAKTMTNELLKNMDDGHWYHDDLVALRVRIIQAIAKAEGK